MLPRPFSAILATVVVVGVFAVAIVGLRITETALILTYTAAITVVGVAGYLVGRRFPMIVDALSHERKLMTVGMLLCAAIYPFFATDPYQIHVMAMAGIFALMAIGLNVTIGFAGLADFGYIAYYAIGAYASALLNVKLGIDFWLCLPLAGLIAASMSLLVGFPALRVKGHYLALVTLGFAFIVMQMITNLEKITGGTQGVFGIQSPTTFGFNFHSQIKLGFATLPYQANFYYLVLVVLGLAAVVCVRLSRSRWGRVWAAMRNDEVASEAVGLNLTQLKLLAFGTGASLGGMAGSLYAHMIGYIDPSSFRFIESIFLLAVVAVGNWRVGGVIAAAVLFTVLPEKLRAFDEWRLLIFGLILLGVMLVRGRRMIAALR
jgi:branched-chain amino acid transport system permease protein